MTPFVGEKKYRKRKIFFYLLLFVFLVFLHVSLYPYAYDDAYIHFRVARNFVETGFPYYNPGEILKVSTSSGWVLVLSLIEFVLQKIHLQDSLPVVISIFNASVTFIGAIIYGEVINSSIGHAISFNKKVLFYLLFIALMLPPSIGLMETPLAILLIGLGIWLILQKKPAGLFFISLSIYFRLELIGPALILLIYLLFTRQLKWKDLIYPLIAIIPFISFDLAYYGTVVPHSMIAKSKVYEMGFINPINKIIFFSLPTNAFINNLVLNGIVLLSLIVFTIWISIKQYKISFPWVFIFLLWSLGIGGSYIIQQVLVFEWYRPLYTIPLLIASFILLELIPKSFMRMEYILLSCVFGLSLFSTTMACFHHYDYFENFALSARVKTYLKVGEVLNTAYPDASLFSSEIGGLGYAFKGKILDAAGLASVDALLFHPMAVPAQRENGMIGAIPPEYVRFKKPELIVSYDFFMEALFKDEILLEYQMVSIPAFLPEDAPYSSSKTIFGSKYIRVFVREDLPLSEELLNLSN